MDPAKQHRILIVTTSSRGTLEPEKEHTGLWLSEFVHFWEEVKDDFAVEVASPAGGDIPLDPRSLTALTLDGETRAFHDDPTCMALLRNTKPVADVDWQPYDAVYFPGGHGTLWDFPDNSAIQALIQQMFEAGRIVAAVCHGPAALLNVRLRDGRFLLDGRKATGYSWNEERLVMLADHLPMNLEEEMEQRGARYEKALVPMMKHTVAAGNLITGQNPTSAKEVGEMVSQALGEAVQLQK